MKSLLSAAATLRSHTALKQFANAMPSPKMALPTISFPKVALPKFRLQRRTLYKAAAVATVGVGLIGTGVASAMFVDYLAERAVERSAQDRTGSIVPVTESVAAKAVPEKNTAGAPELPVSTVPETAKAAPAAPAPQDPEPAVEPTGSKATVIASAKTDAEAPVAVTAGDASLAAKSAANDDEFADRTFTAAISRPARTVEPALPAEPASAAQPVASEQPFSLVTRDEAGPAPQQVALNTVEDEAVVTDGPDAQAGQPAAEAAPVEEEVETAAAEPTRTAKVTEHVNLRSGPDDESKVLMVVPASKEIQVVSCKGWCEVVYDGNRGYIYKSFIE